jgi:hypothetical protein
MPVSGGDLKEDKTMRFRFAQMAAVAVACTSLALAEDRGAATASVNGKKVTIDYGRPALKGRPLSELIKQLSEDRVWRAGDDQVTTLSTDTDLEIGGKTLKAGKYSVYVHLAQDGSRNLILNSDLGQPLGKIWDKAPDNMKNAPWPYIGDYQAKIGTKELVRASMRKEAAKAPVDVFTIDMAPAASGATLKLAWGEESWSLDLKPAK